MRTESDKHQRIREFVEKKYSGVNLDNKKRDVKVCYPDVITENTDFEVEMLSKSEHIKKKSRIWDKSRRKVLVLGVPDEISSLFDEIILFNDKNIDNPL